VQEHLGQWVPAMEQFQRAERFDPRSLSTWSQHAAGLLRLRRYVEAREVIDRGLALSPVNLGLIEARAMTYLGEGDLERARAVLRSVPAEVAPTALVAAVAERWDLVWLLDDSQRDLLLRLTPGAFDNDRCDWALCLTQAYALRGDSTNRLRFAEQARQAIDEQLHAVPDDAQRRALHGVALAYLGRKEDAIREGESGTARLTVARDALTGAYLKHLLARIYVLVGEPEKAIEQLDQLLKIPYFVSPGWLKIDPNFDPLRQDPRFQKLVAGKSSEHQD
jgi:tetratricopeptide (TPR) repeat protein